MGAKQTKIEGSYLSSTPVAPGASSRIININVEGENNSLDPRSPAECRTPIYLQNKRIDTNVQLAPAEMPEHDSNTDNALDILRKRFFKGFTYNLNDPRSPSLNLNRTPLVFEDTLEKSLTLDDTFADLMVEPRLPESAIMEKQSEDKTQDNSVEDVDIEMSEEKVFVDLEAPITTSPQTPIIPQQEFDPRSPSIGVERTPIIFTDDDEADETSEDVMLENILATLTLNLNTSGNSSVVSLASQTNNVDFNDTNDLHSVNKPMNKHLDRVRAGKKSSPKATHRKPKRRLSRQQIYEDRENQIPTTPKLKVSQIDKNDSLKGKRTPLSCVRNRNGTHQARSRSVESSAKTFKTRLALTSFDDTLNPTDNHKVPNLRIMQQGSQDSLEL
ncbi:uncharacterized protein LOC111679653 [Lucilia cuprina]|uniref:uncharacterized protein LOC111679653 n=1 Tax=Lucilia cuprina TaxID=7375 RepID=UPI001F06C854|nr:uncharacterized protein LOC111679653 [Lucilia cuprina]